MGQSGRRGRGEALDGNLHETRGLFKTTRGAGGLAGDDRDLQAGRGLSLHDRERRSWRAVRARRRREPRRGGAPGDRESDALSRADPQVPRRLIVATDSWRYEPSEAASVAQSSLALGPSFLVLLSP